MRSRETIIRLSWLTVLASASRKAFRFARTTSSGEPLAPAREAPAREAAPRLVAAPVPERFLPAALLRAPPLRAEPGLAALFRRVVDLGCGMASPPVWSRALPHPSIRKRVGVGKGVNLGGGRTI